MRPLDFLSAGFALNPWPSYSKLRSESPVWWSKNIGMVCVSSHQAIRHALTNAAYTVAYPFRVSEQVFGRTLLDMDGPEHRALRRAVSTLFSSENVDQVVAHVVEPIVEETLFRLHGKPVFDFMKDVAEVVPLRVIARYLQIPEGELQPIDEELAYLLHHLDGSQGDFELASRTRRSLEVRLERALSEAPSVSEYRTVKSLESELDAGTLLRVMMLLLAAGVETSVCALGNTLWALLRHPDWIDAARNDPAVLDQVVCEALRWEPPQHDTVRFAREDCAFQHCTVRRGQPLKVILASANRDKSLWVNADEFIPSREQRESMSFGFGSHMCLGRRFATLELTKVIGTLLRETRFLELDTSTEVGPRGHTFRRPKVLPIRAQWRERSI